MTIFSAPGDLQRRDDLERQRGTSNEWVGWARLQAAATGGEPRRSFSGEALGPTHEVARATWRLIGAGIDTRQAARPRRVAGRPGRAGARRGGRACHPQRLGYRKPSA